jgi:hypothetical protein
MRRDTDSGSRPVRDLALYQRLISDGITAADRRGGAVDHITARRMSLWLLSRSREPEFMRGLIRFAKDGAITRELKNQLRYYARSPGHPHQPQASRLLQYAVARGSDLGPIGTDFAAICDQIDQADAMLAELRDRVEDPRRPPGPARRDASRQQLIAMARRDPASQTVSLILDDTTANMAIHAITINAADREARAREVEQYGQTLPEGSYGRRNRQAIAARETRITDRLRAIERAYRTALDHDTPTLTPTEITSSADRAPDRELELE